MKDLTSKARTEDQKAAHNPTTIKQNSPSHPSIHKQREIKDPKKAFSHASKCIWQLEVEA